MKKDKLITLLNEQINRLEEQLLKLINIKATLEKEG